MARLIFTSAEFAGQSCDLPDGRYTLGRSRENDLVILDESVSAHHCEFFVYGPGVIVRELNSSNGTFVNGSRVGEQRGIKHGQTLRIGKVEAVLQMEAPPERDETSITGWHAYRQALQNPPAPAPNSPRLPVVFAPRTPQSTPDGTRLLPRDPSPASTTETEHREKSQQSSWNTIWVVVVLVVLSLVALLYFALR